RRDLIHLCRPARDPANPDLPEIFWRSGDALHRVRLLHVDGCRRRDCRSYLRGHGLDSDWSKTGEPDRARHVHMELHDLARFRRDYPERLALLLAICEHKKTTFT